MGLLIFTPKEIKLLKRHDENMKRLLLPFLTFFKSRKTDLTANPHRDGIGGWELVMHCDCDPEDDPPYFDVWEHKDGRRACIWEHKDGPRACEGPGFSDATDLEWLLLQVKRREEMKNRLEIFHKAQSLGKPSAFQIAITELQSGQKKSHWMWFVLPQLQELGSSKMSKDYGIKDLEEAKLYLADPLLKKRLLNVIEVIQKQLKDPKMNLTKLMGNELDATKTISSLTLFACAGLPIHSFLEDQLGGLCKRTLELIDL